MFLLIQALIFRCLFNHLVAITCKTYMRLEAHVVKLMQATVWLMLLSPSYSFGQNTFYPDMPLLESYIKTGLEENLALQQKALDHRQGLHRLEEARGRFFPSLDFDVTYSRTGGSLLFDVPVGDLLNPVYGSLNQLLGENRFPTDLSNEPIPFLRKQEYNTRLRVTQQIFNARDLNNYHFNRYQTEVSEAEVQTFQRKLVREIRIGYFNYLKTARMEDLYDQSLKLLAENRRVTQKLFEAHKVSRDAIYRADMEYHRVKQQYQSAQNQHRTVRNYLNFLLNRPIQSPIPRDETLPQISDPTIELQALKKKALANREELNRLRAAIGAAQYARKMAQSTFLPSVSVATDVGFLGETYAFNRDTDYWMVSGTLQWNLFNGLSDRAKIKQAHLHVQKLQAALDELVGQIELEVEQHYHNVQAMHEQLGVVRLAGKSARENFRIVAKRYDQGLVSQLDYLDARTTLTSAEINEIVTQYDYFIRLAELEFSTAAFDFGSTVSL